MFHLNEANEKGEASEPQWLKEYIFTEKFTDDLSPAGIDTLLNNMADNPDLLQKVCP